MSELPTNVTITSYEVMMHYFKNSNTSPLTNPLFSLTGFPSIYVSRFSKAQQLFTLERSLHQLPDSVGNIWTINRRRLMTAIKYNHEFAQDQSSSAFNVNKLSRYLEEPKEMRRQVCKRILRNLEETSNCVFFLFVF